MLFCLHCVCAVSKDCVSLCEVQAKFGVSMLVRMCVWVFVVLGEGRKDRERLCLLTVGGSRLVSSVVGFAWMGAGWGTSWTWHWMKAFSLPPACLCTHVWRPCRAHVAFYLFIVFHSFTSLPRSGSQCLNLSKELLLCLSQFLYFIVLCFKMFSP